MLTLLLTLHQFGTYTNQKSVVQNLLSPELEQLYWGNEGWPVLLESCP
jgi:hypothetical protein